MMKNIFLVFCILFLGSNAKASEYISTNTLAVIDNAAYLIEGSFGNQSLVKYSFPSLVESKRLSLAENFSYAMANATGIAVYNYSSDIQVPKEGEETLKKSEKLFAPSYFKEIYEINTYDTDLNFVATKTVENQYYYGFAVDPVVSEDKAIDNKCKGKKSKKGEECQKITVTE